MELTSMVVRFAIRLDNNPIIYPVRMFKCGFETISMRDQNKWKYMTDHNLTYADYGFYYARNETGSDNYHLIEVEKNQFNMQGPNELNKMVFDLTTFFDVQ